MKYLPEKKVRKELEDLLKELDKNSCDEKYKKDFLDFINIYWNSYDLKEYQQKANKLMEKYKK